MKRKIIPFLLALALMLSFAVPTFAVNYNCRRICTIQNGRIVCRNVCYKTTAQPCKTTCKIVCTKTGCKLNCTNSCQPSQAASSPSAPVTQTPVQTPIAPNPVTPAPVAPSPSTSSASDFEKVVCELVNAERAKYGLRALSLRDDLCDGARAKSLDMQKNGYFAHESPTYGSPFAMMKQFGISYAYAGENIARGYTSPESVVRAWMNSEGHRANILNASFTSLGVGYVANGNYWTQWFVG